MASVNKAIIVGNLGKEPEVRYMPNGDAVANFSIATTETWKDKTTGEKKEAVEWHNIVMYRKLAEIAGEYLKKGASVYIEGKLQTRKWEKDGVTRYSTEIIADSMQMLGGRGDNQAQGNQAPAAPKDAPSSGFDDMENDIPFMNPYKFNWRMV